MKRFGVMLDMSRNAVMKPDEVKKFARVLKSLGYNMIQLYTEDTYEIEGEPYFGYMRARYTQEELRELDAYCHENFIDFVPSLSCFGHLYELLETENGEYSCLARGCSMAAQPPLG